jgi:glycosyltransferase involved in cell wall biosynthesis
MTSGMASGIACIIPSYNRASLIAETVDSALRQSVPFSEIVVIDDGSTDDTASTLRGFGSRIRVVRQQNAGVAAARARGAAETTAPLLMFLDSDDLLDTDWAREHLDARARAPDVELSVCNHRDLVDGQARATTKFDQAPTGYFADGAELSPGVSLAAEPLYWRLLRWQPVMVGTFLVSRAAYERVGGYRAEFSRWASEDFEFALRLTHLSPSIIIQQPLLLYRRHGQQATASTRHFVAGDVRILEHSRVHHPLGAAAAAIIGEEVSRRSADVVDSAYAAKDPAMLREFWPRVHSAERTWRRRLKKLMSYPW